MGTMKLPTGYLLPEGKNMQDVLRLDAELLAQEGIDPQWAEPEAGGEVSGSTEPSQG